MKLKTLAIVVGILAALSALAFWINRPPPPEAADPRVGQPLVDASLLDGSAGLRFSDQGRTVELSHGPDGAWTVRSYHGLPADFAKLSSFVNDLTTSRIRRFVSANPERIARLEFKDTKIEILDPSGKASWSVTLGKNAEGGGRFVAFGDLSRAYLSSFNAWLDTDSKGWADASLVNLKPEDVAKVEVTFDEGPPVVLSRGKLDASWTAKPMIAGRRIKGDTVSALLGSAGSLRFSDTSDPADPGVAAAWKHSRTIELTAFSGRTVTILLGRTPEERRLKPAAPSKAPVEQKAGASPKAAAPEYETIPAGPVYALVLDSDPKAPVNALMRKRACQVDEYTFTSLPRTAGDLFEPSLPPPAH
jgi:hypothetical protein